MPIDTNISDLWWLKPNNGQPEHHGNEVGEAYAAAMRVNAQNNYLHQLRGQQIEQAMELQRNKAIGDTLRAEGMTALTSHISEVARTGSWDDPEAEAKFWDIASKYPQSIEKNDLDAIYRNTFLEAKRRKDEADRIKLPTAAIQNVERLQDYLGKASEAAAIGDDERADYWSRMANQFATATHLTDPNLPLTVETVDVDGQPHYFYRDARGGAHLIKMPDEGKMSALDLAQFKDELKAFTSKYSLGVIRDAKGQPIPGGYERQKAAIYEKYRHKSAAPKAGSVPQAARSAEMMGPPAPSIFDDFLNWRRQQSPQP